LLCFNNPPEGLSNGYAENDIRQASTAMALPAPGQKPPGKIPKISVRPPPDRRR
jgi:hypothetical protein